MHEPLIHDMVVRLQAIKGVHAIVLGGSVATYPPPLKQTIVQSHMWDAEFALRNCSKPAERGEVFIVAGCLTRIASDLVQTLYALNETYFLSEKRLGADERTFAIKPRDFRARLEQVLSCVGQANTELREAVSATESLFRDLLTLCGSLYKPRFD